LKIAIINVSARMSSDGSRLISALLRRAGHSVKSVFLARPEPLAYEQEELAQLDEILKNVDIVMIAVYSSYAIRAVQVTEFVRKNYPGMKVIWGGPHCISIPEPSLRYADGVCFSEGDQVVVDLVNKIEAGNNYLDTPNMAFNVNGSHIVNDVLPPFHDLDSLPYHDYNLDDQFLLDGRLFQITKEVFREHLAEYYPFYTIPILYFVTSRGCPHRCSFCNNCRYIAMFGRNTLRFQSIDRVIKELEYTLNYFDFIEFLGFGDDDFFMRPIKHFEDFAQKYKQVVGLPFGVAVSTSTYRKEKMEILLDTGLKAIQMGVQSGSQRILDEVYNRKIRVSKTKDVVHQIEQYHKTYGLNFLVDFIIDNPYETKCDIIKTYQFLLSLPEQVRINIFFLAFFPGTPIYEMALKDNFIEPFSIRTFRFYTRSHIRYQKNYETFLILLVRYLRRHSLLRRCIPHFVLRILGSRPVRGIASIFPKSYYAFLSKSIQ
jgi:anaerobic magnesium-protoporphyrin IX monomethyl ester cyclase